MPRTDVRCSAANCGGLVEAFVVEFGRVAYSCRRCERKRKGLCRDCPSPTPSTHHWRCARCAKRRKMELDRVQDRARYSKRRASVLASHKRRAAVPEIREYRRQYMRNFRKTHPRDDQDRAYGRAYMAACRANPAYRAKENRRKRRLRAQYQRDPANALIEALEVSRG